MHLAPKLETCVLLYTFSPVWGLSTSSKFIMDFMSFEYKKAPQLWSAFFLQ